MRCAPHPNPPPTDIDSLDPPHAQLPPPRRTRPEPAPPRLMAIAIRALLLDRAPPTASQLYVASDLRSVRVVTERLAARGWAQPRFHTADAQPHLSWYHRHRTHEAAATMPEVASELGSPSSGA
eukprot:5070124-Prymnesium_polylepis.1